MQKIAVRADGTMVPCGQIPDMELGTIDAVDLKDVWNNHPTLDHFRRRKDIALSSFEFCRSCRYIPYCTGGCPALAYTILGDPWHPSPDSCIKMFLELGGVLPRWEEFAERFEHTC